MAASLDRDIGLFAGLLLVACGSWGCSADDPSVHDAPSYPAGPFGLQDGDVVGNLQLETASGEPFALQTIYQSDVKAALLYVTATWCFTCGPEINWLNSYPPRLDGNLAAMSVLLQNKQFEDATAEDAEQYDEGYGAEFLTLLDPDGELDVFREESFIPLNVVIDVETMRITLRETGFDQSQLEEEITSILETL